MASNSMEFKLRCSLIGHTTDVRAVTTSGDDIISSSRDITTRLWSQDQLNSRIYIETTTYLGHTDYISCVCDIPGADGTTEGFIATGGRDNKILIYPHSGSEPTHVLTGHTQTVSCLTFHDDMLISGSWDRTVRVWKNWECIMTLSGHTGAIWSVAVMNSSDSNEPLIITASADKGLKCWKNGKDVMTYQSHTDCVRGVVVWGKDKFLSCSNDASVKLWNINGDCLATYYGHTNYIYCIASLPDCKGFVTSGEDGTIRVWDSYGRLNQSIYMPAQSIWSIAALPNSDIVAGSSDGNCTVFTQSNERAADEEELKLFEEKLAQFNIARGDIGGIKRSEISDKSILLIPGKKEGQTVMARDGDKIFCYHWSEPLQSWEAVGEVVGAAGGTANSSGKVLHEGKEYDYVFDVDLDEGRTLKMPYNNGDDPYMEAQAFIHTHELPQDYLDQVAQFIISNANVTSQSIGESDYFDPFTGSSRYVPSSSASNSSGISGQTDPFTGSGRYIPSASMASGNGSSMEADPFTGSGRYIPNSSSNGTAEKKISPYFPHLVALKFDNINKLGILKKLKESNNLVPEKLTDQQIAAMLETAISADPNMSDLAPLEAALKWPCDIVWPAVDVLRCAVRSAKVQEAWLNGQKGSDIVKLLVSLLNRSNFSATIQLISLRCLANVASHPPGRTALENSAHSVISASSIMAPYLNKNFEIAAATLALNYSMIFRGCNVLENQVKVLSNAATIAAQGRDEEAIFRSLVAMGTLLSVGGNLKNLGNSLNLKPILVSNMGSGHCLKVNECAKHVLSTLY